jgi:hypothetical protein
MLISFCAAQRSYRLPGETVRPNPRYPSQIAGDDILAGYRDLVSAQGLRTVLVRDFKAVISAGKDLVSNSVGVFTEDHIIRKDVGGKLRWEFVDLLKVRVLSSGTAAGAKTLSIPWIGQGRQLQTAISYREENNVIDRVANVARTMWRGKRRPHLDAILNQLQPNQLQLPSMLGGLGQPDDRFVDFLEPSLLGRYVGFISSGEVPDHLLHVQLSVGLLGVVDEPINHGVFVDSREVINDANEVLTLPLGDMGDLDHLVEFQLLENEAWWQRKARLQKEGYVLVSDVVEKLQRRHALKDLLRGVRPCGPSPFRLARSIRDFNRAIAQLDQDGVFEGFDLVGLFDAGGMKRTSANARWRSLAVHVDSLSVRDLLEASNFLFLRVPRG